MTVPCFREAVCAKLDCASQAYELAVFWHCLYRHARLPVKVLWRIAPKLFADDLDLIRALGTVDSRAEFCREWEIYRYRHPPAGLLCGELKLRLSGEKLMQLAAEVLPQLPGDTEIMRKQRASPSMR